MKYNTIFLQSSFLKKYGFEQIYKELSDEGILFILVDENKKKNYLLDTFEIMNKLGNKNFIFRNMILWINKFEEIDSLLIRNYQSLLFYSNGNNYHFNKDKIREKHIWKDVEWGKRKKNYNPKGKDPGNVWIKTIDNGKGKIIEYVPLSFKEIVERVILVSNSKGKILILTNEKLNLKNKNVVIKNE